MKFLLLCFAIILLMSGCGQVKKPASSHEKDSALIEAQNIINDPQTVMPNWYRARLVPGYRIVKGRLEQGTLRNVQHYIAEPTVSISFFWMSFFISFVPLVLLGFISNAQEKDTEQKLESPVDLILGLIFVHVIAIIVSIIAVKLFVILFYSSGRYAPWHFCAFIGLFIVPLASILEIIISGQKAPLERYKNWRKNKDIEKHFDTEVFSARYAAITEYAELFSDNADENMMLAADIRKEAIEIKNLGKSNTERLNNARKLSAVVKRLEQYNLKNTLAYDVLTALISPYKDKL